MMSTKRKQPAALARAREARERDRLEVRKVEALERIAAALEAANAQRPKKREATTLFEPNPSMLVRGRGDCGAPAELDEHGNGKGWCTRHLADPLVAAEVRRYVP